MKNKYSDLHNHLFEQLERLNDTEVIEDDLKEEIKRANAMCAVAQTIINVGNLAINAAKLAISIEKNNVGEGKKNALLELIGN
jgi:hypothetical protein